MTPEELFEKHYNYATSLSRRYFRGIKCSFFNIDDAVQCGLIGLWQACEKYSDTTKNFKTYSYNRILGNIKDELRKFSKSCRMLKSSKDSGNTLYVQDISYNDENFKDLEKIMTYNPENSMIHEIDNSKISKYVKDIMVKLPEQQQRVIFYRYMREMSLEEISILLGIKVSSVAGNIFRGFHNFKILDKIYKNQPEHFKRIKEVRMDEFCSEYNKKQNNVYTVGIGDKWVHIRRSYDVVVTDITEAGFVYYIRDKTAHKNAKKHRPVIKHVKDFCTRFEIKEAYCPPTAAFDTVRIAYSPVENIMTTQTENIEDLPTKDTKFCILNVPIQLCLHNQIIFPIKDHSPFLAREVNSLFDVFKSYDVLCTIIHDMLNTETWASLVDEDNRYKIIDKYTKKYLALVNLKCIIKVEDNPDQDK
jgi:RNA polymerase sigma factor (sigma-70 family)